jgi:hypothetical protein
MRYPLSRYSDMLQCFIEAVLLQIVSVLNLLIILLLELKKKTSIFF